MACTANSGWREVASRVQVPQQKFFVLKKMYEKYLLAFEEAEVREMQMSAVHERSNQEGGVAVGPNISSFLQGCQATEGQNRSGNLENWKDKTTKNPASQKPWTNHPGQLLHSLAGPLAYSQTGQTGTPPDCVVTMAVTVHGASFSGQGKSRKEAKKAAALSALQSMSGAATGRNQVTRRQTGGGAYQGEVLGPRLQSSPGEEGWQGAGNKCSVLERLGMKRGGGAWRGLPSSLRGSASYFPGYGSGME